MTKLPCSAQRIAPRCFSNNHEKKEGPVIFFNPNLPASLNGYGIPIPLHATRTTLAFDILKIAISEMGIDQTRLIRSYFCDWI